MCACEFKVTWMEKWGKSSECLLALAAAVTGLLAKVVEVLGLDDVNAGIGEAADGVPDLVLGGNSAVAGREAAAPVVDLEGVIVTLWPNLDATVADHLELKALLLAGAEHLSKVVWVA